MIITTDDFKELGLTKSNATTIARIYPYKRNYRSKKIIVNKNNSKYETIVKVWEYDYNILLNIVEEKTRSPYANSL